MIKTLYKTFQHWSETGSVYIISDPHFMENDMNWRIKLIEKFEGTSLEKSDMHILKDHANATIIANYIVSEINKTVKKNDTIIFCGDIGNVEFVPLINAGFKILITGNHDRGNSYYEKYFHEIYNGPLIISNKILLSHEPITGPWLNIHGHVHCIEGIANSYLKYVQEDNETSYLTGNINVSCEVNGFRPVNLGKIVNTGILNSIEDVHRITINKATKNKK